MRAFVTFDSTENVRSHDFNWGCRAVLHGQPLYGERQTLNNAAVLANVMV